MISVTQLYLSRRDSPRRCVRRQQLGSAFWAFCLNASSVAADRRGADQNAAPGQFGAFVQ